MRTSATLCLCLLTAVIFGCASNHNGGGDNTVPADQGAIDNAPDLSAAGIDEGGQGDLTAAENDYSTPVIDIDEQALGDANCHPHLFQRMRAVVLRLNKLIAKGVERVKKIVGPRAKSSNGSTTVWVGNVDNNQLVVRLTVTRSSPGNFTVTGEVKAQGQPDSSFVTFLTGNVNNTAGTPHTGSGQIVINFSAINGVAPTVEKTTGSLTVNFNHQGTGLGAAKKVQVTLSNYDPHGVESEALGANANYVFERVVGTGGSFKAQWMPILACPQVGGQYNTTARATVSVVHRYKVISGGGGSDAGTLVVNSRTDAYATGGQMGANESFTAETCAEEGAGAEGYWMMRYNKSDGTFVGYSDSVGTQPCDTTNFGQNPNLGDKLKDYIPSDSINFANGSAIPFCVTPGTGCTPPIP